MKKIAISVAAVVSALLLYNEAPAHAQIRAPTYTAPPVIFTPPVVVPPTLYRPPVSIAPTYSAPQAATLSAPAAVYSAPVVTNSPPPPPAKEHSSADGGGDCSCPNGETPNQGWCWRWRDPSQGGWIRTQQCQ